MEKLKVHILRRAYRHTYIGRRHMSIDDFRQGLPKHERDMRNIERAVKELINEGYLIPMKLGRVSINPRMLDKIREIV
jgi:DNA polymerase II small subunit/DNA polymerase delta subunit B